MQSTDLAYMEVGEVNAVPLHPPTDIWHLVSLALVLEEAPHATLWLLHPAAPPSLLAGTLQVRITHITIVCCYILQLYLHDLPWKRHCS